MCFTDHRRLGGHFCRQRHDPDPLAHRLDLQDRGAPRRPGGKLGGAAPKKEALPWWLFGIVGGLITAWLTRRLLAGHLGLPPAPAEEATALHKGLYWGATFAPGLLAGLVVGWLLIAPVNAVLGRFFWGFNFIFDLVTAAYGRTVGKLLRLSVIVLVVYGGLLGLTGWRVASTRPALSPRRTRAICSSTSNCRTQPRCNGPTRSWPGSIRFPAPSLASPTPSGSPGNRFCKVSTAPTSARCSSA